MLDDRVDTLSALHETAGFERLRELAPISWSADVGAFIVVGHREANEVLRGEGWSSDFRNNAMVLEQIGGVVALPSVLAKMMLFMDPPGHTRMRALVAPAFAARSVERFRPRISSIVDAALIGLGAADDVDVLADLAYPVPIAVIAELLDVGLEGAGLIRDTAAKLVGVLEIRPDANTLLDSAEAAVEVTMFLLPLLAERQANPGHDLASELLCVETDGERLELEEVLATCILLLIAGHETTANLIANGVLTLLRNPEELARLRDRPELIGAAVEEILRVAGPVKLAARTAVRDQSVGGVRIASGDQVLVHIGAANRDAAVFETPDRFDIGREGRAGLAFGAGPHFCLGAALARVEAEETLLRLFGRFPNLGLRDSPRWRTSTAFHALDRLTVGAAHQVM